MKADGTLNLPQEKWPSFGAIPLPPSGGAHPCIACLFLLNDCFAGSFQRSSVSCCSLHAVENQQDPNATAAAPQIAVCADASPMDLPIVDMFERGSDQQHGSPRAAQMAASGPPVTLEGPTGQLTPGGSSTAMEADSENTPQRVKEEASAAPVQVALKVFIKTHGTGSEHACGRGGGGREIAWDHDLGACCHAVRRLGGLCLQLQVLPAMP